MNPGSPARSSAWALRIAIGVVMVAAAFWVYWPAVRGGWVWDDGLEVAANPLLRDPHGWWKAWTGPTGLDILPLKTLAQWLQWQLWGNHVVGYHVTNVFLHAAGALLLWRLIAGLGLRGGGLAALLFAVHPMAVESVAWIAEFKNVLSLPLLLLALDTWVRGGPRWAAWLWFVAALLCKPSPVLFPGMLIAFRWWQRGRVTSQDVVATMPFFAASVAVGVVTLETQWHHAMTGAVSPSLARWSGANLISYAATAVWPFDWSPVYGPWRAGGWAVVAWLFVALLTAILWTRRRGWGRHGLLVEAWFLCATLPVIGLVPLAYQRVAPRADHLGYLALAGLAAALGVILVRIWDRVPRQPAPIRAVCVVAVVALCAVWASQAHAYAAVYRDEATLWTFAARRAPDAWLARNNLGRAELAAGRPADALVEFRAAEALKADSAEVHANEGNALLALGRRAESLEEMRLAAKLAPNVAGVRYDVGRALLQTGDNAGAAAEFTVALRLDPRHAEAHNNLGLALVRQGQFQAGIAEFHRALELNPNLAEAHLNLGNANFRRGDPAAAAAEYRRALASDPTSEGAQRNLATALRALGDAVKP